MEAARFLDLWPCLTNYGPWLDADPWNVPDWPSVGGWTRNGALDSNLCPAQQNTGAWLDQGQTGGVFAMKNTLERTAPDWLPVNGWPISGRLRQIRNVAPGSHFSLAQQSKALDSTIGQERSGAIGGVLKHGKPLIGHQSTVDQWGVVSGRNVNEMWPLIEQITNHRHWFQGVVFLCFWCGFGGAIGFYSFFFTSSSRLVARLFSCSVVDKGMRKKGNICETQVQNESATVE